MSPLESLRGPIERLETAVAIADSFVQQHPQAIAELDGPLADVWIAARSVMTAGTDILTWMGDETLWNKNRLETKEACRSKLQAAFAILPKGTEYRTAVAEYLQKFT